MPLQETPDGFRAEIQPMRRRSAIVFAVAFAAFGAFAWYLSLERAMDTKQALYGAFISLFLVVAGVLSLVSEVFGNEIIELNGYVLKVYELRFGFRTSRSFDITMIKNLRVGASSYWQGNTYVMANGRIQFDYDSRMRSIGGNVSDDEAFAIVNRIRAQITPEKIGP